MIVWLVAWGILHSRWRGRDLAAGLWDARDAFVYAEAPLAESIAAGQAALAQALPSAGG